MDKAIRDARINEERALIKLHEARMVCCKLQLGDVKIARAIEAMYEQCIAECEKTIKRLKTDIK